MPRLELTGVSKQYPAVRACERVNLRVKPGEIHAVLGENGAGKSTLMKIIVGAVQPDESGIRFNGQVLTVASPAQARALGISMVHQHLSLFDTLTAAENVWLGLDKSLSLSATARRITDVASRYGRTWTRCARCTRSAWANASAWRSCAPCWPNPSC